MNRNPAVTARTSTRPRVALVFAEHTKSALVGIAQYVRTNRPWSFALIPTAVEDSMPLWLAKWDCDGIIGRIVDQRTVEVFRSIRVPFVDLRGDFRELGIALVHHDDAAIGREAADHLLERGFKHFAFCGYEGVVWSGMRRDSFLERTEEAGYTAAVLELPLKDPVGRQWERRVSSLSRWLTGLPKPVAVMAANDALGQHVLLAAQDADLAVPDVVAVIGVDNDEGTCEVCDPPLTSVPLDHVRQGYEAAALLDRLMLGEQVEQTQVFLRPPPIRVRQSTDVLAIDDPFIVMAVRYIREHACDGIGVSDVLREVPLSRSVLQRRFRRLFGKTVNDAIIDARLKRAKELLTATDLSLPRIAQLAGFRHQQYMGAVFRKRLKTSPARYRREVAAASGGHAALVSD